MNFFDHKDLGNHLLQLCPKVVKHPVYIYVCVCVCVCVCVHIILSFKYYVFSAWRWLVQPKYVPCIDRTNKIVVADGNNEFVNLNMIYHNGINK